MTELTIPKLAAICVLDSLNGFGTQPSREFGKQ